MIADAGAGEGDWLVALDQLAGRGRQGRAWVSAPGNFFGSTLVELGPGDPPAPSLSLAAGLALIEAIDGLLPAQPLMLKWPNDVLLLGRKLAGILLERNADRVVVGFGVNLASAPSVAGGPVAAFDGKVSPQAFAPVLAASFARLLGLWRGTSAGLLAQAWLARAHPLGTQLTVHAGADETVSGTFDGIEPDGALRLRRADGMIETVRAGDVRL